MCDVVEDGPRWHMLSAYLQEVKVDSVQSQRQSFEEHEDAHQDVDSVYRVSARAEDEGPEEGAQGEQHRHHSIESR